MATTGVPAGPDYHRSMRRALRAAGYPLLIVVFVVVFAATWVRLPLFSFGPGPAREVSPLIRVDGAPTYGSAGHLVMTTIRFDRLTALGALTTWVDPDRSVVGEEVVYPPGLTPAEEEERAISQMDQSKIDAVVVVLSELTDYPREHGPGALVESVGPGCPADGELFPGDVIVRIEGERVDSRRAAIRLLDRVPDDEPIDFRVRTDDETHDVRLTRGVCPGSEEPLVGILLVATFPLEIAIESGEVGGPSAGLMWALGLYDLMTPGDLTRGRTIAGTGSIDLEGNVGPIGGVRDKVVAAREAGADVLLVPEDNLPELRGVSTGGLELISVSSFEEAVDALAPSEPTG
jgi:PDZ domain-containing protein